MAVEVGARALSPVSNALMWEDGVCYIQSLLVDSNTAS